MLAAYRIGIRSVPGDRVADAAMRQDQLETLPPVHALAERNIDNPVEIVMLAELLDRRGDRLWIADRLKVGPPGRDVARRQAQLARFARGFAERGFVDNAAIAF